ncbi:MAG: hypothetical protein WBD56_02840, partial [Anaerolineales bacterium]
MLRLDVSHLPAGSGLNPQPLAPDDHQIKVSLLNLGQDFVHHQTVANASPGNLKSTAWQAHEYVVTPLVVIHS